MAPSKRHRKQSKKELEDFPILTPERQVEVDTLNGPFSIGARVFAFYEQNYHSAIIIKHTKTYSQYNTKCISNEKEHWKRYKLNQYGAPSFFPLSCLQVGDVIFLHDDEKEADEGFISTTLTYVPSKNNPTEWAAGVFKGIQETKNVEEPLDWRKFYMTEADGANIYKQRFTCEPVYPREDFMTSLSQQDMSIASSNLELSSPNNSRDLRASTRRSRNDTVESNLIVSTNGTPNKRVKREVLRVKQSPSGSTISLHESGSDDYSLTHHPELLTENQMGQGETLNQTIDSAQSYAIPSFLPNNGSTTSSRVSTKKPRQSVNVTEENFTNEIGQKMWQQLEKDGKLKHYKLDFSDKEFEIPKFLLDTRSAVFAQLSSLSTENVIKIEGCNPEAADVFVEYLYCGKSEKLDTCAFGLLPLAEKYEMVELKDDCLKHLDTLITDDSLFTWIEEIPQQNEVKALVLDFIKNKASDKAISSVLFNPGWFSFAAQNVPLAQEIQEEAFKRRDEIVKLNNQN